MAVVLATLYWRATPGFPHLQAIELEDDVTYDTLHPHLASAQAEMATYVPQTIHKVPHHGVLCPSQSPMMLMRSRLVVRGQHPEHTPLTANWTPSWYCPGCGKTTAAPDMATSGHAKLNAIAAFEALYRPNEFTHSFPLPQKAA